MPEIKDNKFHDELCFYLESHSLKQSADYFGKKYKTIQAYCKKHNLSYTKESKKGKANPAYKHGMEHTQLCNSYRNMLARCYNKNRKDYKFYGERGIKVCDEWRHSSVSFFNWAIKHGYLYGFTLDRIDVNGDYTPDNCRWVDFKTQCNNRRSNILCTYQGETKTLTQWCNELNLKYDTVRRRIRRGLSVEEAFRGKGKNNDKKEKKA